MHSLVALLLVGLIVHVNGTPDSRTSDDYPIMTGMYPYQASLRYLGSHICSGSIIDSRYVLTTASCLYLVNVKYLQVVVGTDYTDRYGTVYQATKLVWHRGYNITTEASNVGLIYVDRSIVFDHTVWPIELTTSYFITPNTTATVTGWGSTSGSLYPSNRLRVRRMRVLATKLCNSLVPNLTATAFCAYPKEGQGACFGDKGSPLVVEGKLVGMLGRTVPCGMNVPHVFINIIYFDQWIRTAKTYANGTGALGNPNPWAVMFIAVLALLPYLHSSV